MQNDQRKHFVHSMQILQMQKRKYLIKQLPRIKFIPFIIVDYNWNKCAMCLIFVFEFAY